MPSLSSRRSFLHCLAATAAAAPGFDIVGRSLLQAVGARRYTNPVFAGSMPDPGVILHDGVYYAFGTTGRGRKPDGRVFTVLRSENLVDWVERGGALVPPRAEAHYEYWAPEAAFHDGTFFLYYATGGAPNAPMHFELRVATSRAPAGPYTDTGTPIIDCDKNPFTIDAHPFRDDDGQWYLFYARDYLDTEGGVSPGTAVAVDRLVGMTRLAGECRTVVRARHPWTLYEARRKIYDRVLDWHTLEGPWVRKHDGRYYCFYSGSNYQTVHYGVDVVVADRVMGPWTGQGREARVLKGIPGAVRGPGHHSIVTGPDGKTDYMVYHAWDPAMKVRQMCLDRLAWTAEGPRCQGPTVTPQPVP